MSDTRPVDPEARRVREGIATVCAGLTHVRRLLNDHGDPAALDALLAALRGGADPAPALDRLQGALREAEIARSPHYDTGTPRGSEPGPRTPASGGWSDLPVTSRRAEAVFLCPVGACSRSWLPPGEETATPVCEATGRQLRWERI
ncbi:hypothetical protein [Streptomyces sp. SBT349]|uniref:hypothetical protein n=1 Tax=Streptomyces sp. SBT349 TaxID=1580539 RepID=UPI00066AC578|nr:hypothetical protein [Streptomyces sp. SBT349]